MVFTFCPITLIMMSAGPLWEGERSPRPHSWHWTEQMWQHEKAPREGVEKGWSEEKIGRQKITAEVWRRKACKELLEMWDQFTEGQPVQMLSLQEGLVSGLLMDRNRIFPVIGIVGRSAKKQIGSPTGSGVRRRRRPEVKRISARWVKEEKLRRISQKASSHFPRTLLHLSWIKTWLWYTNMQKCLSVISQMLLNT